MRELIEQPDVEGGAGLAWRQIGRAPKNATIITFLWLAKILTGRNAHGERNAMRGIALITTTKQDLPVECRFMSEFPKIWYYRS